MRLSISYETYFSYVLDEETGLVIQTFLSTTPNSVIEEWIKERMAQPATSPLSPLCVALHSITPRQLESNT